MPETAPGLSWGIKTSFLKYVFEAAGGAHFASGMSQTEDGRYFWPLTATTVLGDTVVAEFSGSLRIIGHGGSLDLELTGLRLTITEAEGGTLSAIDLEAGGSRFVLARLRTPHPAAVTPGIREVFETSLDEEGKFFFNDNYPVGTHLEPLTVQW
ncbi:HtaA domain-containing protein [Arthrobacter sp. ISL-28]|uniref:HtaA domain-containing protein n=1 Tax=Arthrobacter sp. ISL-28 TaxID=2819108 RepID=UPI001BE9FA88|nr:HtaA domain-containing protein [Arthrobacter sp. ISL-28]MBT2523485.1 HtaA domain-containing protein [Arthrobacter sp. ISL-28]